MVTIEKAFPTAIEHLLAEQEGQRLDFKSARISPSKLSKTLASFANTDGGEVFVGIEDDRTWVGFSTQEAANPILDIVSQIFPLGDFVNATFIESDPYPGLVLKLEVNRTPDIKKSTTGDVYVRFGPQDLKKTDQPTIRQLEYSKGVHSFEDTTISGALEDVSNSESIINFALNIVPNPEPLPWLRKQRLIVEENPTIAALMLFSDEPQINTPKSGVKIYRYKTSDEEGTRDTLAFDPLTVEGSAYELIRKSVEIVREKVQDIPKLGDSGLENILYPAEAIHEIITNAIIHRDYSVNDEVHIRIFDNRIEVFSPGKLPGYVTVRNILKERFARNPKIVRILNKFPNPPNKDVGEGLNTAFERMRELKLRDPQITETAAGVLVSLYHELLASPEELVEKYLHENAEINNSRAREICRIGSENTVKRLFDRMIKSGIIERIPDRRGKATAYRLKRSGT